MMYPLSRRLRGQPTIGLVGLSLAILGSGEVFGGAPGKAGLAADVQAFKHFLPAPVEEEEDRIRPFLDLPASLRTQLRISQADLRAVDPGFLCQSEEDGSTQQSLGSVGRILTICLPNRRSVGLLTLADGTQYITVCGPKQQQVQFIYDLVIGTLRTSRTAQVPPPAKPEPERACSGWKQQPASP